MKIIALGDTHGRTVWQKIITQTDFDKVVFIGDYFDSRDNISPEKQKENFRNLLQYKRENREKVILLFGNHDYHYLKNVTENYSGYQPSQRAGIEAMLEEAMKENLMQMCFVYDTFLFSHAGVTRTWCRNYELDLTHVEKSINDLFVQNPEAFRFQKGRNRDLYGDDVCQPPIWVRPHSLSEDAVEGFTQVVGHTTQVELILSDKMILIDALGTSGQYLSIADGEMFILESNYPD
jgi:hypothetical protein